MENLTVQVDAGEEEQRHLQREVPSDNLQNTDEIDDTDKTNRKREHKDEVDEVSKAKKPSMDHDDHINENNTVPDDSISLDIGDNGLLCEKLDSTTIIQQDVRANDDTGVTSRNDAAAEHSATSTDGVPSDALQSLNDTPATSNYGESGGKENKEENHKVDDGEREKKKEDAKEGDACNLWVSDLSGVTRDLKLLCNKHGKVVGAKIVTDTRMPGSHYYGYVTMATLQDAKNCIIHLHKTELHGSMISVEAKICDSKSTRRQKTRPKAPRPCRDEMNENLSVKDDKDDRKFKTEPYLRADSYRSSLEKCQRFDRKERDMARARASAPGLLGKRNDAGTRLWTHCASESAASGTRNTALR